MSEASKSPVMIIILLVAVAIIFYFLIRMLTGWECNVGCRSCLLVGEKMAGVFGWIGETAYRTSPFHPICMLIPV